MNVLSLFDGISCGRLALERANLPAERYDACEIDKYAIAVSKNNFPDIVQHGNVLDGDPADDIRRKYMKEIKTYKLQLSIKGNNDILECVVWHLVSNWLRGPTI